MGEEPNHTMARNPCVLYIIQYSLLEPLPTQALPNFVAASQLHLIEALLPLLICDASDFSHYSYIFVPTFNIFYPLLN
jgi:hypothetical protein